MIPKYLNPKNDIAFKKIFGTEKNKNILLHFLNDMLIEDGESKIQKVTLLNPVQQPEISVMKQSIVDVLCQDESGVQYIVEMQVSKVKGFEKRAQYYVAKAYANQLDRGDDDYSVLRKVVFLAIAEYVMFPDNSNYKSTHVITNRQTNTQDLKDFKFTFIELPKFNKNKVEDLHTLEEKWCYFLKNAHIADDEATAAFVENSSEVIKKAYYELEFNHWTRGELQIYEDREKSAKDAKAIMAAAVEEGEARGEARGLREGELKGKAEGLREGERKGKAEGEKNKAIEIAKKMLAKGQHLDLIADITGLTLDEISSLTKNK